jgi:hypothetical protein
MIEEQTTTSEPARPGEETSGVPSARAAMSLVQRVRAFESDELDQAASSDHGPTADCRNTRGKLTTG